MGFCFRWESVEPRISDLNFEGWPEAEGDGSAGVEVDATAVFYVFQGRHCVVKVADGGGFGAWAIDADSALGGVGCGGPFGFPDFGRQCA